MYPYAVAYSEIIGISVDDYVYTLIAQEISGLFILLFGNQVEKLGYRGIIYKSIYIYNFSHCQFSFTCFVTFISLFRSDNCRVACQWSCIDSLNCTSKLHLLFNFKNSSWNWYSICRNWSRIIYSLRSG